jgi:hypothetical protein
MKMSWVLQQLLVLVVYLYLGQENPILMLWKLIHSKLSHKEEKLKLRRCLKRCKDH